MDEKKDIMIWKILPLLVIIMVLGIMGLTGIGCPDCPDVPTQGYSDGVVDGIDKTMDYVLFLTTYPKPSQVDSARAVLCSFIDLNYNDKMKKMMNKCGNEYPYSTIPPVMPLLDQQQHFTKKYLYIK